MCRLVAGAPADQQRFLRHVVGENSHKNRRQDLTLLSSSLKYHSSSRKASRKICLKPEILDKMVISSTDTPEEGPMQRAPSGSNTAIQSLLDRHQWRRLGWVSLSLPACYQKKRSPASSIFRTCLTASLTHWSFGMPIHATFTLSTLCLSPILILISDRANPHHHPVVSGLS
jgi:hypothetical protein